MRSDATLAFIPIGGNQSMVSTAGTNIPSVDIIDLLGLGVGTAPTNIIGNVALFGTDAGVGRYVAQIDMAVGTPFTTASGATLNVALQGAADTAVTYQPATWTTIRETGPIAVANLTAGQVIRLEFAPDFPANLDPRYLRLLFQVPAATDFTAGTISYAIVTTVRDDLANKFAAKNFTVQ